jgi:O-antigen ligase
LSVAVTTLALPSRRVRALESLLDEPSNIAVALRRATYALLWLFVFTVPWQGILALPGVGTIARAAGVLAAIAAAATLYVGGREHRIGDVVILTAAFACWVALSLLWDVSSSLGVQRLGTVAQLAVMVYLMWEFGQGERLRNGLMTAWVAGSLVVGGAAILKYATGIRAVRYSAGNTNPDNLAYLLALAIPLAWYLSLRTRSQMMRLAYRLFVPVAVAAALMTATRSGLILLPVALLIVPVTIRWVSPPTRIAVLAAALGAAAVGASFLPSTSVQRLSTFGSGVQTGAHGRFQLWQIGLNIIDHHPILGVGAGASRVIVQQSYFKAAGLSNAYLSIFAELGVIGISLFLLTLLCVIRAAVRRGGLDGKLAAVLSLTTVIGLIPLHLDYNKSTWVMIALLALIAVQPRSESADPQSARSP